MDVMANFEPIQLICDTKGILAEGVQNNLQPLLSAWIRAISIEDMFPARYTQVKQTNVKGRPLPTFQNVLDGLTQDGTSISHKMERLYYHYSFTMFKNSQTLTYLRVNQSFKSQLDAYIAILCSMTVFRIIGGPVVIYPPTGPTVIDYNDKEDLGVLQQVTTDLNMGPYQPRSQSGTGFHFRNNQPQTSQQPMKKQKKWQNTKRGNQY